MKKAIRFGCVILAAVLVGSALTPQQPRSAKKSAQDKVSPCTQSCCQPVEQLPASCCSVPSQRGEQASKKSDAPSSCSGTTCTAATCTEASLCDACTQQEKTVNLVGKYRIGIRLQRFNDEITVDGTEKGGSAEKAGLKAGDVILTINGKGPADINTALFKTWFNSTKTVRFIVDRNGKTVRLDLEPASGGLVADAQKDNGKSSQEPVESKPTKASTVKPKHRVIEQAWLGIETRQPTPDEIKRFGLEMRVRVIGQLVSRIVDDGPATKAGVRKGDVLLALDDMEVYSQDDIADFMAVSIPGQSVKLSLRRGKNKKRKTVKLRLGINKVEVPIGPRMRWQYASLAQFDKALETAKKQGKRLLIGLTGAET